MISNILEQEDIVKGMPDQALQQEAQAPSGMLQQFLVISEIKRRTDMRKRFENQNKDQPQGTVAQQILMEGIGGMMPQQGVGMPPQMGPQQMPPQGGPQMPPQGGPQMPPQGMPPQMPPQGMPPQMPPQGAPMGMPPMQMAAGGIVRMQNGGFLDQYVAGAEAGPMPGGSTVRDQIDRLLASGMSYPEVLSFISKTFYGRPEVLEYVQSKVGMPQASMGDSMIPEAREALEREPYESQEARMPMLAGGSDIYKAPMVLRAADALGLFDSFKEKPEQERMAEPMASALVRDLEAQYATPDYMTTAPAAGGRPFDFDIDLDMPSRARPSMDFGSAIRGLTDSPAVSRLGEVGGGIADIFGAIGSSMSESVRNAPLGRAIAASEESAMRDPDRYSRTDALPYVGDKPGVESVEPVDQALAVVQEAQTDRSDPRYRPDFSIMEDYFADFATGDKSVQGASPVQTQAKPKGEPEFDISDILEESRSMTKANMLMQLGAGIAEGDLSGGLSRAGAAGMKGAQEQRALDMRKRLAEYQAGRQDIAREEKSKQFYDQLAVVEKRYANELEKSARIGRNELFRTASALVDAAVGEAMIDGPARQALVENLMNKYLNLYGPSFGVTDVPEIVGGMQTGAGSSDPLGIRGTL